MVNDRHRREMTKRKGKLGPFLCLWVHINKRKGGETGGVRANREMDFGMPGGLLGFIRDKEEDSERGRERFQKGYH